MNEELVTTLATNIIGVAFFSFIGGLLAGWYPPTYFERVQKAMEMLQGIVTRYHIEWDDTEWDYIEDNGLKDKEDNR